MDRCGYYLIRSKIYRLLFLKCKHIIEGASVYACVKVYLKWIVTPPVSSIKSVKAPKYRAALIKCRENNCLGQLSIWINS